MNFKLVTFFYFFFFIFLSKELFSFDVERLIAFCLFAVALSGYFVLHFVVSGSFDFISSRISLGLYSHYKILRISSVILILLLKKIHYARRNFLLFLYFFRNSFSKNFLLSSNFVLIFSLYTKELKFFLLEYYYVLGCFSILGINLFFGKIILGKKLTLLGTYLNFNNKKSTT